MPAPVLTAAHYRDFQSLQDLTITFEALTVVVGANSVGKSALVRGLKAAMFNWSGQSFIREGSDETSITLTFGDRGRLTWSKTRKGGGRVELDTPAGHELITRMGKAIPPEILQLTGVREIGAQKITPQFADQFAPAFVLSSTGSQAAALMAQISGLDIVVSAQRAAKTERDRVQRAADEAAAREVRLQERLDAQPDYAALLTRWTALDERYRIANERRGVLVKAEVALTRRRQAKALTTRWADADLPARAAGLMEKVERLSRVAVALERHAAARATAEAGRAALRTSQAVLAALPAERLDRVQALDVRRRELTELVAAYRGAAERHAGRLVAHQEVQAALTEAEDAVHEVLEGLEVCPVCERPL